MNILELNHEELVALAMQQAAELEQLRPKPPKFRKGQVVFCAAPPRFFQIARFKHESGRYYYTNRMGQSAYDNPSIWVAETNLRNLTESEINGEETALDPAAGN